ncbi:uncharacterized protein PV09_01290 [Verruconis gallopava]|uniref:SnoaL-like domain-containing protein n=1 Tax=Verruconis gallopava TaxID=253628 RepID=A0A0D2BAM3_9PEZI|nr:uncharacterized protein PV09_01290 [Verruconis gallopava]KIW08374.1 hypothetical protein PV09_01290 [Verruconis gallopava]
MVLEKKESKVSHGRGWEDAKTIPVLAWMEKYTVEFFNQPELRNNKDVFAKWHTADTVHQNSDGSVYTGLDACFTAIQQIYAPFAAFVHEPRFWTVWEVDGGFEMVGQAVMYADLPVPGGEKAHEDMNGKKWDLALQGMFHFWYSSDPSGNDGFKMKRSEVYSDTFPAVQEMMKRGMVPS